MTDDLQALDARIDHDREDLARGGPAGARLDAMFAALAEETVDRPARLRDRLRELPTGVRVAAATVLAVGLGAALVAGGGAHAFLPADAAQLALTLGSLVGMVGLAVAISLRGLHRRPVARVAWTVTALALGVPFVAVLLPALWFDPAASPPSGGLGLACLGIGLATAAAVGGVVRLFQREDGGADWRLTSLAGAGGLVAFATLQLHCPASGLAHLLLGHAAVGVLFTALVIGVARLRRA